ncbi:hypothetical protein L3i20_v225220 [Paenibacillus sp. L3-i20]|nr:hypothetical protein L3i20_v225220 [Paenibacillus sp. L3-i20]
MVILKLVEADPNDLLTDCIFMYKNIECCIFMRINVSNKYYDVPK